MNETHWCEDKDTLVDYVYGELDADSRRVFEGHVRTCVACAMEIEGLQSVRGELAEWMPPEAELDFTITPKSTQSATVLHPPRWSVTTLPAWARVAAAVFIVGAGMGLANVQVRSNADGVTISTGWMQSTPSEMPRAAQAAPAAEATAAWQPELAALEADLRKEMEALRASASTTPAVAASRASSGDDQALIRRVQALIDASEKRQEQQFARQMTSFSNYLELQRRTDLVRLEQGMDRFQGRSGAAIAQQQRVLDLLVRASTSKVP